MNSRYEFITWTMYLHAYEQTPRVGRSTTCRSFPCSAPLVLPNEGVLADGRPFAQDHLRGASRLSQGRRSLE